MLSACGREGQGLLSLSGKGGAKQRYNQFAERALNGEGNLQGKGMKADGVSPEKTGMGSFYNENALCGTGSPKKSTKKGRHRQG